MDHPNVRFLVQGSNRSRLILVSPCNPLEAAGAQAPRHRPDAVQCMHVLPGRCFLHSTVAQECRRCSANNASEPAWAGMFRYMRLLILWLWCTAGMESLAAAARMLHIFLIILAGPTAEQSTLQPTAADQALRDGNNEASTHSAAALSSVSRSCRAPEGRCPTKLRGPLRPGSGAASMPIRWAAGQASGADPGDVPGSCIAATRRPASRQ